MKKYAEMINKIFEIFIFEKMDENLFWYLEDVFVYYLEFKVKLIFNLLGGGYRGPCNY